MLINLFYFYLDFQEFMIGHTMRASVGMKDMTKRLQRIEEKISNRTDNVNDCDRLFNISEFSLPVKTELDLWNLNIKLADPKSLNNMVRFPVT